MRRSAFICLILALVLVVFLARRSAQKFRKQFGEIDRSPIIYANPDYYDYLHDIQLGTNGNARLVAGAGQRTHFEAKGKYRLDLTNQALELFDLIEIHPLDSRELRRLPAQTNRFRIETNIFAMFEETIFKGPTPDDEPVVVFPQRYVFETDPLAFAQEHSRSNLYYIIETRDLSASERIYYRNDLRERITLGEAKRRGLKLLSKSEQLLLSPSQPPK